MKKVRQIEVLKMIAADMAQDAHDFEGKAFNGKNVSIYLGSLGAAIAALANILADIRKEEK